MRACISPNLLADVIATAKDVFVDKCNREQFARCLNGCGLPASTTLKSNGEGGSLTGWKKHV